MSERQRVTDGVPASDSKSVRKLNLSYNTFRVRLFPPYRAFTLNVIPILITL